MFQNALNRNMGFLRFLTLMLICTAAAEAQSLQADTNRDGKVDWQDITISEDDWLLSATTPQLRLLRADINHDGHIDLQDYAILTNEWLQQTIPIGLPYMLKAVMITLCGKSGIVSPTLVLLCRPTQMSIPARGWLLSRLRYQICGLMRCGLCIIRCHPRSMLEIAR